MGILWRIFFIMRGRHFCMMWNNNNKKKNMSAISYSADASYSNRIRVHLRKQLFYEDFAPNFIKH